MNNTIEYRGYVGSIEFNAEDQLFFGKVQGIRSLISYAVGCMLGRYSLDADGLAYAGGEWGAREVGNPELGRKESKEEGIPFFLTW